LWRWDGRGWLARRVRGWWRADPSNNSVFLFLAHNMLELEQLLTGIGLVYMMQSRSFKRKLRPCYNENRCRYLIISIT